MRKKVNIRWKNQYTRYVCIERERNGRDVMNEVFSVTDKKWQELVLSPESGFEVSEKYKTIMPAWNLTSTLED